MRHDVMIDLETLGTGVHAPIFQISAVLFDIKTGKILEEFQRVIDINTIPNIKIETETLKWWLKTNPTLMADLIVKQGTFDYLESLDMFAGWIKCWGVQSKETFLWGNGENFDNVILRQAFVDNNMTYPIRYDCDRDLRTLVDMTCMKTGMFEKEIRNIFTDSTVQAHDARNDTLYQIRYASWCYNMLTNNDMVSTKVIRSGV